MFSRFSLTKACILGLASILLLQACKNDADKDAQTTPWTFNSELARYQVTLPPAWKAESDPKSLNSFADLAANIENTLFLIVIPQKLPVFPIPDARAVKSAGMEMMQQSITDLHIKRQGDIVLDDVPGVSVFLEGTVESERIQYIATYMTQVGWGYQIIAWGPATAERRLIEEVDQVLAGWKFLERDSKPSALAESGTHAPAGTPPEPDPALQKILDSLENPAPQPESADSHLLNSDQDDETGETGETGENTNDSQPIEDQPLDSFSEGN